MKMLILTVLAGLMLGQPSRMDMQLQRTRDLIRAHHCCAANVVAEPTRDYPPDQLVVRYVDREKGRLGVMIYNQDRNQLMWYGWVMMNQNLLGRTLIVKDWMTVVERQQRARTRVIE